MTQQVTLPAKTKKITKADKAKAYKRIKAKIMRVVRCNGLVTCHFPKGVRPSICKGSYRFEVSVETHRMPVSKLVYNHKRGCIQEKTPVFNLCSLAHCCKPSHLVTESITYNKSRSTCYGYLSREGSDTFIKVCPHEPPCIKVTKMESLETINPKDIDPGMSQDFEDTFEEIPESELEKHEEPEPESEVSESEVSESEASEYEEEPEPISKRTRIQQVIKSLKK